MLNLDFTAKIHGENGVFSLPYVSSIEVTENKHKFTDTAKITFPRKVYANNKIMTDYFNVGDFIEINFGYKEYAEKHIFKGYITGISPEQQTVITIENRAFLYKSEYLEPKVHKDIKLKALIEFYFKDKLKVSDLNIGTWVVNRNVSFLDLLSELKNKLNILSFWHDEILYCGYDFEIENRQIKLDVNHNIVQGSNKIQIKNSSDIGVISYGISPQRDSSNIELYAYYSDASKKEIIVTEKRPKGTLNELKLPNVTKENLTKLIKRRLPNLYTNSLSAEVETYGYPIISKLDIVNYTDKNNENTTGTYSINEISKEFSAPNGIKQHVKFAIKLK